MTTTRTNRRRQLAPVFVEGSHAGMHETELSFPKGLGPTYDQACLFRRAKCSVVCFAGQLLAAAGWVDMA